MHTEDPTNSGQSCLDEFRLRQWGTRGMSKQGSNTPLVQKHPRALPSRAEKMFLFLVSHSIGVRQAMWFRPVFCSVHVRTQTCPRTRLWSIHHHAQSSESNSPLAHFTHRTNQLFPGRRNPKTSPCTNLSPRTHLCIPRIFLNLWLHYLGEEQYQHSL